MRTKITIDFNATEFRKVIVPGTVTTERGETLEFEIVADVDAMQPQDICVEWADAPIIKSEEWVLTDAIKQQYLAER